MEGHKTGINLKDMDVTAMWGTHALAMKAMDFCLEEYIDYLIAHPHIALYQDGALKYEIYRVEGGNADSTIS